MKNRQHHCQKKKYKKTNNNLQNILIKLKIESGVYSGGSEGLAVPDPLVAPVVLMSSVVHNHSHFNHLYNHWVIMNNVKYQ